MIYYYNQPMKNSLDLLQTLLAGVALGLILGTIVYCYLCATGADLSAEMIHDSVAPQPSVAEPLNGSIDEPYDIQPAAGFQALRWGMK